MKTNDKALFEYCLRLGDGNLILGQRLGDWCGHGPFLEEDIAMTNIALDLIGQARNFLTLAGEIEGKGQNEDDLAYKRDAMKFRNHLLVEQPNGDFAMSIARQFMYDCWQHLVYHALKSSSNESLAALGAKADKEAIYHLRHSRQWVLRLGDGTQESHNRIQQAFDALWKFKAELFIGGPGYEGLVSKNIAPDLSQIETDWDQLVFSTMDEATLSIPENQYMLIPPGESFHTEHLGHILSELQFLPRAYPDAKW